MSCKVTIPRPYVLGLSISDNEGWMVSRSILDWLDEKEIKHKISFIHCDVEDLMSAFF
jgi:hypothetical protein